MMPESEEIRRHVIRNAFLHEGKADMKSVMNKILGEYPEYRKDPKSIIPVVKRIIDEVNSLTKDELDEIVSKDYPDLTVKEKRVQEHRLPDLESVGEKVVMRLAPSPSGPLHVGHSRMAILNDEYVKRYGGELILRLEDTNPGNIDINAYDLIPKDLEWLNVNVTKTVIQTDRMEIYYSEARNLIKNGHMYVCECSQEEFKKRRNQSMACEDRDLPPDIHLDRFERMINREYPPGSVSAVVKTDLNHPNPSVRDWVAFRVTDIPHPRVGDKYVLYPTMNFGVATDDHLLGLTHVIRGVDHLNNTEKQKYIFNYNKWKSPVYFHYGFISIPHTILKTSIIKKGIIDGTFTGWDDIRLGTIMALKKRGYAPETFRRYWIESGMRESNAEFSWDIFNSMNKENVDSKARRYFFVPNPVKIKISGGEALKSKAAYHPGNLEMGYRVYDIGKEPYVYVSDNDWKNISDGTEIRLKDLCKISKAGNVGNFSEDNKNFTDVKIIQWCPDTSLEFEVLKPDGTTDKGLIEPLSEEAKGVVQLERYGYVNILSKGDGYFLHR